MVSIFWWLCKQRTLSMLTDVTHFCILLKRNGCGVFLHLYVRNILYGIGSALVKRFVILELFRDASCRHSVGMQAVRSMRAWSLKRYGNGTKIQKMKNKVLLSLKVIVMIKG